MRLGQLSRKINVRTSEIVRFLASKGIAVEDSVNSRIDDEHVRMVAEALAPEVDLQERKSPEEPLPVEASAEVEPVKEQSLSVTTNAFVEEPSAITVDVVDSHVEDVVEEQVQSEDTEKQIQELPDVIKAPKIELQGLRVLGKIDLPQPKKKESESSLNEQGTSPSDAGSSVPGPEREKRTPRQKDRRSESRPRKNPIVLQREREEREAAEKKKEAAKREKEKRTQFYQQRVKPAPPVRSAKLIDEPLSQLSDEKPDEPKTWWGKFVKWLTT